MWVGGVARVVTQQYLLGELLVRLARLQAVAPCGRTAGQVAALRREAESAPLAGLGSVVVRALRMAEAWCWGSLAGGDAGAFARQACVAADLFEFGVCSGLLADRGVE